MDVESNIAKQFLHIAKENPERIAVIDEQQQWTYRELLQKASVYAEIVRASIAPHDKVGIRLSPSCHYPAIVLGIWMANGIAVPLNTFLADREMLHIINDSHITFTIDHEDNTRPAPKQKQASQQIPSSPNDCAAILYTSGTDADPKGVMLSHKNILANIEGCAHRLNVNQNGILSILPLFHAFGFTCGMLFPLLTGVPAIIAPGFTPTSIMKLLRRHKPHALLTVPSIYRMLLKIGRDHTENVLPPLCVAGGEPLSQSLRAQFKERFNISLLNGYGMTEHAPVIAIASHGENQSVGKSIRGTEIRIVQDENEKEGSGEIWVRGTSVMMGYLNKPNATSAVITNDGWLKTGDVGYLDRTDNLHIVDRKKDLIISSGENISPSEIESVIAMHAAVAENAVIGVPDERKGEVPVAFVALDPNQACTESEIIAFCKERLAPFKVPRTITFLPELPHNAIGKIAKKKLR